MEALRASDEQFDISPLEEEFNNGIREITIFVLAGIVLCLGSHAFLTLWCRKDHTDEDDCLQVDGSWEDSVVYKVSLVLCTISLAISVGAALLLPISSIANEVLHRHPNSWYIKWLNSSLINGLWNIIFVLSNLSLFIFLPFAYLFYESEGLPFFGHRQGIIARVRETVLTLLLLAIIVLGMMFVMTAMLDHDVQSSKLGNIFSYLPFLYSCVSFFGVLMLLLCTPFGFAHLFTVIGGLVVKPTLMRNLDEEYYAAKFEEDSLRQKVDDRKKPSNRRLAPMLSSNGDAKQNSETDLEQRLSEAAAKSTALDRMRKTPTWQRILNYPLAMISLLLLTGTSLGLVVLNVLQLMTGYRSLPVGHQHNVDLGLTSLSTFGAFGVLLEVLLITYLFVTSLVGLYTIPVIRSIRPKRHDTTLTHLILNCALFVILSSALPLLAKILGITNFDLLGSFGEVKWLGNFYIILISNAIFAFAAGLFLVNTCTARARNEIMRRLALFMSTLFKRNLDAKQALGAVTPVSATSSALLKTD